MTFKSYMRELLPHKEEYVNEEDRPINNPITICRLMTPMAWAYFACGAVAWGADAYDFFCVSLSVAALSKEFGKETKEITLSITLTLLFRSVGAVILGLLSDRYGRKWPLVINLLVIAVLQLATSFVTDFHSFLAVRSLFGLCMGGVWGLSAATALENAPVRARGLLSGLLQQFYAVGYLVAAVVNLTLVADYTKAHGRGWRTLFWVGTGLSVFGALFRAVLPESASFARAKVELRAAAARGENVNADKQFLRELGLMLKKNWLLCIHAVLLMAGMNFLSHGSQDLYPTYLQKSKNFTPHQSTLATIIGNCGAIFGGMLAGYASQILGRRFIMLLCLLLVGAFIPVWTLPTSFGALSAGAFLMQMAVQGAWGVIPILLSEMSPVAFRGTFPGVAYQLGNAVSSSASQIEATAGERWKTTLNGIVIDDYKKIMQVLLGVVAAWTFIMVLLIKENRGASFESTKPAFVPGAGEHRDETDSMHSVGDIEKDGKGATEHFERA